LNKNHQVQTEYPSLNESHGSELVDFRLKYLNYSNLRNDVQVFKFNCAAPGFGTGDATISSVRLLDPASRREIPWLVGGERVSIEIVCLANAYIDKPIIGFQIKDRIGQVVFSDNTYISHQNINCAAQKGLRLIAEFEFIMPLLPAGEYSVSPAIANGTQEQHVQLHWLHDALILNVQTSSVALGLMGLPMNKISFKVE